MEYFKNLFDKLYNYCQDTRFYLWLTANDSEYVLQRKLCGFFYGLFMGFLFWKIFVSSMDYIWHRWSYLLMLMIMISLGLGCAFKCRCRCTCIVLWLGCCGRAGRSVIKTFIVALIVTGPISNLISNSGEVVRTFTCSTELTYNLTKVRFDLLAQPFHNALAGMKEGVPEIEKTFSSVEDVLKPIQEEIEGNDLEYNATAKNISRRHYRDVDTNLDPPEGKSAEEYQTEYTQKLKDRCELQLKRGADKCRQIFQKTHDECYEKIIVVARTLLCWPMKLDFICDVTKAVRTISGTDICSPSLDEEMGENYANMLANEAILTGNFSNVAVEYEVVKVKDIPAAKSSQATGQEIMHEFQEKKSIFDYMMSLLQKILAFIFLKVILNAIRYTKAYCSKIDHDNIYITSYFQKIDLRRTNCERSHLLPLKKIELKNYVDPKSSRRLKSELTGNLLLIIKLVLELITITCFIILDSLFYETLDLVRRHAIIEYKQEGVHDVNLTVVGTGIIANLVRSTVSGFSSVNRINITTSNEECLPKPNKLSNWFYFKIYGLYVIAILLIYNDIYFQRMRSYLCGFFYRKRQKARILYLYNFMLKRRKRIFKYFVQRVKERMRENRLKSSFNVLVMLRLKNPKRFGWLRIFTFARRKCVICDEREPRKRDHSRPFHFAMCLTPDCHFVHCDTCWFDVGEICLACRKYQGDSDDGDPFSEDENQY